MLPVLPIFLKGIPVEYYSVYLIDYKIGITSRTLIGSVVDMLTKTVTSQWLDGFILVTFLLTFSLLSFLLMKLINNADEELKNILLYCVLFFSFYQLSVRIYTEYYGILDIYWFLFFLLSLVFLNRRFMCFLVPGLCLLGLATNYAFAFTFMPVIAFILIFNLYIKKFALFDLALTTMSLFVMAVSSVYFFIFANNTLVMTYDEIIEYLSAKAAFPVLDEYIYLYFSKDSKSFLELLEALRGYVPNFFASFGYYPVFLRAAPVLFCIFMIWTKAVRFGSSKIEKGLLLIAALIPIASLPAFLFSLDIDRFLAQVIISQISLVFYLVFRNIRAVVLSVKHLYSWLIANPIILILCIAMACY